MKDKTPDFDISGLSLEEDEDHAESSKAKFKVEESQDPEQEYTGPERRRMQRRQTADRRGDLRFEEKGDRRSGKDRRKGGWNGKFSN